MSEESKRPFQIETNSKITLKLNVRQCMKLYQNIKDEHIEERCMQFTNAGFMFRHQRVGCQLGSSFIFFYLNDQDGWPYQRRVPLYVYLGYHASNLTHRVDAPLPARPHCWFRRLAHQGPCCYRRQGPKANALSTRISMLSVSLSLDLSRTFQKGSDAELFTASCQPTIHFHRHWWFSTIITVHKRSLQQPPSCSSTQLDHGVLIVSYGADNGAEYWVRPTSLYRVDGPFATSTVTFTLIVNGMIWSCLFVCLVWLVVCLFVCLFGLFGLFGPCISLTLMQTNPVSDSILIKRYDY